jgi:oligosaccharide repeat unit polymerase
VAFDRIVQNPSGIRSSWSISRFFLLTANKLGASFEVPSLHAEYTMISPTMKTNVYTMYFSYFQDYGWAGIVVLPCALGYALTWIYRKARNGSHAALVLYGLMFSGILVSGFAEVFFLALNTLLKAVVVVWLVFSLPGWWRWNRGLNTVPLNGPRVPSFPASL